jgi:hypothetical protein
MEEDEQPKKNKVVLISNNLITEFKTNPVISNNSFFEEFEGIIY